MAVQTNKSLVNPSITVIVPVYNTQDYLAECLDSVCGQSFSALEIICIDDGSRDASGEILDARAEVDSRIRVFHQENAGVSRARNVGLNHARGKYILFVDSDDFIELNTCEKLFHVAEKNKADIVVFGGETFPRIDWIDSCFNTHNIVYRHDSYRALFQETGSFPLMCNKMYSRNLLNANDLRFNEELKLGEDNAFQFCTFPRASCIAFCLDVFYHYRCEREGSAIDVFYADRLKKVDFHFDVVKYVTEYWDHHGFLRGHRGALLTWMSVFLFDDVQHMNFNDRFAFAQQFDAFYERYGFDESFDVLDEYAQMTVNFIRGALSAQGEAPIITIVTKNSFDPKSLIEGFASLANQSEQRIEIVCIDDGRDEEVTAALLEEVSRDQRARVLSVAGPEKMDRIFFSRIVEQACGRYVLFASLNDRYQINALEKMLEAADEDEADIVTIRDAYHNLRTQSMTRFLNMSSNLEDESDARTVFAPQENFSRLFNFASLSSNNKLYRKKYIDSHVVVPGDPCSVAGALLEARVIRPLDDYVMEINPSHGLCAFAAEAQARSLAESYTILRDVLRERKIFGKLEKSYINAVLTSFFCCMDSMRTKEAVLAFYPVFREVLSTIVDLDSYDKGWFYEERDFKRALLVKQFPADIYLREDNFRRIDEAQKRIKDLEMLAGVQRHEIDEFYTSISYRVGRSATFFPRKIIDAIRYVRG
ncbi:MAG: glycosyltransferase family 2 protein [Raoultibacter sp.]